MTTFVFFLALYLSLTLAVRGLSFLSEKATTKEIHWFHAPLVAGLWAAFFFLVN